VSFNPIALTRRLLQIPSCSGEETALGSVISEELESLGFRVCRQSVQGERFNIWAFRGNPVITFATHMDTVQPFLEFHEDETCLYGRGACDAKGIIAVQIAAAKRLLEAGMEAGVLFLVGEEAGSDGARKANQLENDCRFLIMGEPTDNRMATGTKGALRLLLRTEGTAAHSSCPEEGDSALLKLIDIVQMWRMRNWPHDPVMGSTTWNVGRLQGGRQANVIPDRAEAEIMFRLINPVNNVLRILQNDVKQLGVIDVLYQADPVRLRTLEGFETMVASFATDIPLLNRWGEPFLLGPGSIIDAHSDHEKIKKTDLTHAVDLYFNMACRLLE